MRRIVCGVLMASVLALPRAVSAQNFEVLGSRAQGMGGAFVAVADDASATYWNPAGLAMGAYFSLMLDYSMAKAEPDDPSRAGSRSGTAIAFGLPALGVSYYRLRMTTLRELPGNAANVRLQTLITHHTGATLVQSITDHIAVGTTLKLVRGIAATGLAPADDRDDLNNDDLLNEANDLIGSASNKFDADIGVIATTGHLRAGLTIRNAVEPEFEGPGGTIEMKRQFRAGVALTLAEGVLLAADFDLDRVPGTVGDERNIAIGAEARLLPRLFVRSGFRVNTVDEPAGARPVVTVGGSYRIFGSMLVDGQGTLGSESGDRGWGVGARLVF